MSEQYKAAVPLAERVAGWLYDADSGVLIGLASDELKRKHPAGVPFKDFICGCPHNVVIHKAVEVVNVPTVLT